MSTSIELATEQVHATDLERMAAAMSRSSLFGKNPDQILSLMLIAQAEGLHPATAVLEYDIIQGKPALKSQSALARFQRAGGKISWKTRSDAEATAVFSHPQGGEVTVSWNMEKAKRMGLGEKENWKKQPGIMLQWRTVAEGVRVCYPACLNRMYLVEEVQDFDPPKLRDVSPPAKDPEYIELLKPVELKEETSKPESSLPNERRELEKEIGILAMIKGKQGLADAKGALQMIHDQVKEHKITPEQGLARVKTLRDGLKDQKEEGLF